MTILGIDISHYQGAPNFAAVKSAGIGFVFMKGTQGSSYVDPEFYTNRTNAHAAGLAVGIYHFASNTNASVEANYFCSVVGSLNHGDLVALDWEVAGSDPVGWSLLWLRTVESRLGVKPLLYLNQSTVAAHDWTPVVRENFGLWLADYDFNSGSVPNVAHWPLIAIKQYSDRGAVSGIAGAVDLDVFEGDATALEKYGYGGVAPAPVPTPTPHPAPPPAPTPPPPPAPHPAPHPAAEAFPLPHNEYFGLITGPAISHGGANPAERTWVKQIQTALQRDGFAPNAPGWADGIYQQPTADAVAAFQRARMPGTTKFGQVWFDDWAVLIQGAHPAPVGDGSSLPTMALGETSNHVVALQKFLNAYNWRPSLPLLPCTGYYGPETAAVLHHAGLQLHVQGDTDGHNFGPHFKAAFWKIGFRG
jgi:GH25 family lysozyme M1 (1,4-beta-N-acetylmuramidase)